MKQKHFLISLAVLAIGISVDAQTKDNVKTTFQTSREWKPSIDNRADAVMVYGVGGNPSDKSRKLSFEEAGEVLEGAWIYHTLYDRYCLG